MAGRIANVVNPVKFAKFGLTRPKTAAEPQPLPSVGTIHTFVVQPALHTSAPISPYQPATPQTAARTTSERHSYA
jgi:hypothetical protein